MPNSRRCRTPCHHRIPAQHRRSLWPRKRSARRGGRGRSDAVWPHHDTRLRPLSDGAEALSTPPGQTIPAVGSGAGARPRHGRSGTRFTTGSPKICSCQSNRSPHRHPKPRRRVPPQSPCHRPMSCHGGSPPSPRNPPGAASPWVPPGRSGSHSGVAAVSRVGSCSVTTGVPRERCPPPRSGVGTPSVAPPSPPAAPSGTIPVCRTRVPSSPRRVPRPPAFRAALTCPRSAQAEPPPLPLPPAPSFTSAPFW